MTDELMQPYQRIVEDVRDQIRLGRLKGNEKLPSLRQLAEHYSVAPGTVQRALAELRTAGLIYSHQGRGSYVRESAADAVADPVARALKAMEQQIADLTARLEAIERAHDM